jgi:hypothetical protein
MRSTLGEQTKTTTSAILNRKIENTAAGLRPWCTKALYSISKENADTRATSY